MKARTVLSIVVFVAVVVLRAAPSMAYIAQPQVQVDFNSDYRAMEWFGESPVAYQYKVAHSMRYGVTGSSNYPWSFMLSYDDFDYAGQDGTAWTAVVGYRSPRDRYEEALEALAWGIRMIEEYWNPDEYDTVLYEGIAPYVSYKYEDFTVGGYILGGYTFSDEQEVEKEFFYGIGAAGSYKWQFMDDWQLVPRLSAQYYDSGQPGWEESLSITADIRLKYDISDRLAIGATFEYTVETADDVVDSNWYGVGLKISGTLRDNLRGYAGVRTTQGFDGPDGAEFDDFTVIGGLQVKF